MYGVIFSEEWWMQTATIAVITALITALATIIAAALAYNFTLKTTFKNSETILTFKEFFMREYQILSKEHQDLSKSQAILYRSAHITEEQLSSFVQTFSEEKSKSQMRYDNLNEKQKNMIDTVSNIQAMAGEIKFLASVNKKLLENKKQMEQEIQEIRQDRER